MGRPKHARRRKPFTARLGGLALVALVAVIGTAGITAAATSAPPTITPGTYTLQPGTYTWVCTSGLTNGPNPGYWGVANTSTCKAPSTTTTTTTSPTTTTTTQPTSSGLLLGSYNGSAQNGGISGGQNFANQTGTAFSIYSDYTDSSNECSGEPFPLPYMHGALPSGTSFVLSVPLPGFSLGNNGQQLLANDAASPGNFDACMANLGYWLVHDGFANAVIRLMWEPDAGIYSNDDLTSAQNYATVWRDAWTSMMGNAGAHFQWDWYYGGQFDANTNNTAWPGAQYVTHVTFDQYDQSWTGNCGVPYDGSNWSAAQSQCIWNDDISHVLGGLTSFAAGKGKPLSIGEWGVINRGDGHGGGDDPTFVNNFAAWMKANNVSWASYFNFNSGGDSILSDFPNSFNAFKADL
jgi:hypothetical protein